MMTCVYNTQQLQKNDQKVIKTVCVQSHLPQYYRKVVAKYYWLYTYKREKMEMTQNNGKDNIINGS